MSLAYYIVLDNDNPGFETFVNGKAVARAAEALDGVCDELNLPPLDHFLGESLEDLGDLLGMKLDLPQGEDAGAKWFDAGEGIALMDALIAHLQANPQVLTATAEVLEDLAEYRALLDQARAIGAKWHLAIDM